MASAAFAADPEPAPPSEATRKLPAPDPSYLLSPGDTVAITVYNEPDLSVTQTLGRSGDIRVYLIGEIILAGRSTRDAEHFLESTYKERNFLVDPVVTVTVTAYFPREVTVLGAVKRPGTVVFPRDSTTLDIIDVISQVGGFLPISQENAVRITRRVADGKETVITVDLDKVISGRRQPGRSRADVSIIPGDRIWVPERLF